ncbi:MAG: hypothetical protein ACI9TY_001492 [Alphaproteobacteria bacterium]|jgi:hypothetical protein
MQCMTNFEKGTARLLVNLYFGDCFKYYQALNTKKRPAGRFLFDI